jgi:hypothetical protein
MKKGEWKLRQAQLEEWRVKACKWEIENVKWRM